MNPTDLAFSLEDIADGVLVQLKFRSGDEFELSNCEVVDESIYDNKTTLLADVVQKLAGDKRFNLSGTKLEFSALDIMSASIVSTGTVLYEANT